MHNETVLRSCALSLHFLMHFARDTITYFAGDRCEQNFWGLHKISEGNSGCIRKYSIKLFLFLLHRKFQDFLILRIAAFVPLSFVSNILI